MLTFVRTVICLGKSSVMVPVVVSAVAVVTVFIVMIIIVVACVIVARRRRTNTAARFNQPQPIDLRPLPPAGETIGLTNELIL